MSIAADALQPSFVRGLFELRGRGQMFGLADAITTAPKSGFDLDFEDARRLIVVDFRETTHVTAIFGGDACRFASASFASISTVSSEIEDKRAVPWALIKLYYSAFYAGHSILRLLGQSCSYLEPSHVQHLRKLTVALGLEPKFTVDAGLYHFTVNGGQTGFALERATGRVGGAHEAFWKVFGAFIEEMTEQVLLGRLAPGEAREVFLKLDAWRSILQRHGAIASSSWLSAMRNEIQYKLTHKLWPPASLNKHARSALARIVKQWERDPMNLDLSHLSRSDLEQFVLACTFTVTLCRVLLARIAERSSAGPRSFASEPLVLCC
ncbi:hypothetical protein JQ612_15980 [Bradyrhizobium manausense]|uniref:hypothetical protein n=1 Tax=Bradyrhizobium manausense TaxID=989370 RepID=UPI001BA56AD8|nr:hypothetical protein [Bradyrhizobium manausense]MBR0834688.1 hypothetical protein [Bradyrhizobium manausense]